MKTFLKYLAFFIVPIAIIGWTIEKVISKIRKKEWQFDVYSAIPFFLGYVVLSFYLLTYGGYFLKFVGIYIITAMQALSFALSIAIILGTESDLLKGLKLYGKRDLRPTKTTFTFSGLVIGLFAFLFSIYFFSCLYFFINSILANQFSGVVKGNVLVTFFDFFYFSFATITTSGSTISPLTILPKIFVMIEVIIGLFYLVFLFGAFLSIHISKIYEKIKSDS